MDLLPEIPIQGSNKQKAPESKMSQFCLKYDRVRATLHADDAYKNLGCQNQLR